MVAEILNLGGEGGTEAREGWAARLELGFARHGARTVLANRRHLGPLRVQKALYPEGNDVCQVIVVHPPAGIVGGDTLAMDFDAGAGCHVQITTPGAAKWYRASGVGARARTTIRIDSGSFVEWLPQENLLFDGARATIALRVDLAGDARFLGWDVTALGRTESDERFSAGCLRSTWEVARDDALVWCERGAIDGGSRALQAPVVLNGAPVFGTMVAAGVAIDDEALATLRAAKCSSGPGAAAVTRMPDVFVARYRGDSAPAARAYFVTLWQLLRPIYAGRGAIAPRIWST